MKITCNLYAQWTHAMRAELATAGYDVSSLNDQDCAIRFISWKRRTVPTGKRTITRASDFVCPAKLQLGLEDFELAVTQGGELWRWQSKRVGNPSIEDGLFNDYGIAHFHLGVGRSSDGFVNRTGELLFALVTPAQIYEVGVYNHGDWYEMDILEKIESNWPHLLDRVAIRGFQVAGSPSNRDEVKALREGNVQAIRRLSSGRIIAPPGGGVATDGTSAEAVMTADRWAKLIRNGERLIQEDIAHLIASGEIIDQPLSVLLHVTDDEISGVFDGRCKWTLWKKTK